MKKFCKASIIAFVIFLMNSTFIFAQDVIVKKDKEQIRCKVTEVGITEIKYKAENNPDGPIYAVRKNDVSKIIYNGAETIITPDQYSANKEQEIRNKTKVLKFDILSPATGKLSFGYEQVLKVGTNLEGRIGIIGPHTNGFDTEHASGAFVKGGIKFLGGQDIYIDGLRYKHPLKGRYIRLDLMYSHFTNSPSYYTGFFTTAGNYYTTNDAVAFNICLGKQWILSNALTLDIFGGVGYGISSVKSNAPSYAYNAYVDDALYFYSHLGGTKSAPITLTGGFSLGYIL